MRKAGSQFLSGEIEGEILGQPEYFLWKDEFRKPMEYGAHPNDLIVNLIELLDNRRLRRHLPNK
jgi:hypothetical protein